MADPLDDGRPFEVEDLWRPSAFLDDCEKNDSLFDFRDSQLPSLSADPGHASAHFTFDQGDLGLPPLPPPEVIKFDDLNHSFQKPLNDVTVESSNLDDEALAIWSTDLAFKDTPRLHTWEAFTKDERPGSEKVAFLSEAGPLAFDAALHGQYKSGEHRGVMPQDATLRALCNLSLGRSSVFFQWSEAKQAFHPVLDHVSISGLSVRCTDSFIADVLAFGNLVVRLRRFTEVKSDRDTCPSITALRSGVSSIISAARTVISTEITEIKTLLQLQTLILRPRRLLEDVQSTVVMTSALTTDTAVIASLADFVYTATQADDTFCSVWQAFLARVSRPWLESLAADLGFHEGAAISSSIDEERENLATLISPLSSPAKARRMKKPSFLKPEESSLIKETKSSLNLVRQYIPDHPLNTLAAWNIRPPTAWFYGAPSDETQAIYDNISYETRVIDAVVNGKERMPKPVRPDTSSSPSPTLDIFSTLPSDTDAQEDHLARLNARMSEFPNDNLSRGSDELLDTARTALEPALDYNCQKVIQGASFGVVGQAMSLVKTQFRLANGALVRHLFRDCQLQQHLEVHRMFSLLQSGDFADRLSTALFSSDVQSAERRRGVPPTGQALGLRLGSGERQRWPPASSELQLTLMGILGETYRSQPSSRLQSTVKHQLPGDLSFAIRELSEEEIDRVLDPGSIHALDFLRLQYTAPAPLDTVLTTDILQKYDSIFRFLLVLLRLNHAVTQVRAQACFGRNSFGDNFNHTTGRPSSEILLFGLEAQHFVCVLTRFVMDAGISASWRQFSHSLGVIAQGLQREDDVNEVMTTTTVGIEGLRKLHDDFVERIRGTIFLRKRHEKLYTAVETVLSAILKCALCASKPENSTEEFHSERTSFRESMSAFYALLQERIDKPLSTSHGGADLNAESDLYRILLSQLS